MKALRKLAIAFAIALISALAFSSTAIAQNAKAQPADTILINGKVYTVDSKQSWAQAVAIRGEGNHRRGQ